MRVIGVINVGNAESVVRALFAVGADPVYVNDPSCFGDFDALVMPGQGSMANVSDDIKAAISAFIKHEGKYLGICLGMQMLCTIHEEGGVGLGFFNHAALKLARPRVGWEAVDSERGWFYFCHGYSIGADVIRKRNVTGVQFHPERSGKDGLRWLAEWVRS